MSRRVIILLYGLFVLNPSGLQAQVYFYDVCMGPGGGSMMLGNGVTVTCASFGVGTGQVSSLTGTADVELSPEGTRIQTTSVNTVRNNDSGWTNYIGLSLYFDQPIVPAQAFYGADIDAREQMTIFGYNRESGNWVMPLNVASGSADQVLEYEYVVLNFPLPPGASSPTVTGLTVPTVNTEYGGDLNATDISSQFFPDFGGQGVTDLFFLYAKNHNTSTNGGRSVFVGEDFDLLEIAPEADLFIVKTVDESFVNQGAEVEFTVTLGNDGPDDATGIVLSDPLPSGFSVVSVSASTGSYNSITGTWTVPILANGAAATLTVTAEVLGTGNPINQAQITASDATDPDSETGNGFSVDDLGDSIPDDDEAEAEVEVNDPPAAMPDAGNTAFNTAVPVDVSGNDTDSNGNLDPGSFNTACTACTGPGNGSITYLGSGVFEYSPDAGFTGTDMFIYEVCDDLGLCDTAVVIITVDPDDCLPACTAAFTAADECLGNPTDFDAAASIACDPAVVTGYTWSFGDGNSASGMTASHTYSSPGNYLVTLIIGEDNGCMDTVTADVEVFPLPTVFFGTLPDICANTTYVLPDGMPSGGTWSGTGVNGSVFDAAEAGAGIHQVVYTVTGPAGCTNSDTSTITVNNAPTASIGPIADLCINDNAVPLPTGSPAGGVYEGAGAASGSIDPAGLGSGSFTTGYIATNNSGCSDTATLSFDILPLGMQSEMIRLCEGDTFTLNNGTVVSAPGTYSDTVAVAGMCDAVRSVVFSGASSSLDTLYRLCGELFTSEPPVPEGSQIQIEPQQLVSQAGCDSTVVLVTYSGPALCPEDCRLFIPNAFTPNRDGNNDGFNLLTNCESLLTGFELSVYNRWGERVFQSYRLFAAWDGTFKGAECPIDVYTYIIHYNFGYGELTDYGVVSLIR